MERFQLSADILVGSGSRERFDAPHPGRHGRLMAYFKESDLPGRFHMNASAEFHRKILPESDHAHFIPVLFAKECHGTPFPGFVKRNAPLFFPRDIGPYLFIDKALYLLQLLRAQLLIMRKVEAQIVGPYE